MKNLLKSFLITFIAAFALYSCSQSVATPNKEGEAAKTNIAKSDFQFAVGHLVLLDNS